MILCKESDVIMAGVGVEVSRVKVGGGLSVAESPGEGRTADGVVRELYFAFIDVCGLRGRSKVGNRFRPDGDEVGFEDCIVAAVVVLDDEFYVVVFGDDGAGVGEAHSGVLG